MDYELRMVVEKVADSSQEVLKRDTLKVYDIKAPESRLDLGLRHEKQVSLLEKVRKWTTKLIRSRLLLADPHA